MLLSVEAPYAMMFPNIRLRRMKRLLAFTSFAYIWNLGAAPDLAAQDLVITNARIIAGNGAVINSGSVVVRAGKIVSVAQGAFANAQGARVIDAKGMTVMPGFIDARGMPASSTAMAPIQTICRS